LELQAEPGLLSNNFWDRLSHMNAKTLIVLVLALYGCSSQPRFTSHGENVNLMFDNKTAQNCWAGPLPTDNAMDDAVADLQRELKEVEERAKNTDRFLVMPHGVDNPLQSLLEETQAAADKAQKRVDYLNAHPEQQKLHVHNGLPYCSELK
jgi:hypothetical protein